MIVPAFGVAALGCLSVAILIVTLTVSPLRWLAARARQRSGSRSRRRPQRFDIYVDRAGIGAALRGRDGRLVLVGRRPPSWPSNGCKADGDARRGERPWNPRTAHAATRSAASLEGPGGRLVALVEDRRAFAEDCGRVAIVVSRLTAPPSCAAATVIDGAFLETHGATAIRFTAAGADDRDRPHAGRDPPLARRRRRSAGARASRRTRASKRFPRAGAGPDPPDGDAAQ